MKQKVLDYANIYVKRINDFIQMTNHNKICNYDVDQEYADDFYKYNIRIEVIKYNIIKTSVSIPKWLVNKYKINKSTSEKLKINFLIMFLRYSTLIESTAEGMQMAVPASIYKVLRDDYNAVLEGFASPLNNFLDKFCSVFPDTDSYFGSQGSFYDLKISELSYLNNKSAVINPPYQEEIMLYSIDFIIELLKKYQQCIIFWTVPKWDDAKSIIKANSLTTFKKKYALDISKYSFTNYSINGNILETNPTKAYIYVFSNNDINLEKLDNVIYKNIK